MDGIHAESDEEELLGFRMSDHRCAHISDEKIFAFFRVTESVIDKRFVLRSTK